MKLFKKFLFGVIPLMFVVAPVSVVQAVVDEEAEVPATIEEYSDFDWESYYDELYEAYDDYGYDTTTLYGEEAAEAAGAAFMGTAIAGTAALVIAIVAGGFGLLMYVYTSLTMMKTAQKLNHENPWFAWIPILNIVQIFQLGEQNPWLIALVLIPGLGALIVGVISLIALMKICEKRGYDKLLALLMLIPIGNLILLGMLAWGKKEA